MNEYELYKTRHELQGLTSNDSSVNRSKRMFNNKFESSVSFYEVLVNGVSTDVIVNQGKLSNFKTLLFRPDTNVNKGDVVEYENKEYLIIDFDTNKVYPTAKLELCNSLFPIIIPAQEEYEKDENGEFLTDDDGRPILIIKPPQEIMIPCISETKFINLRETHQLILEDGQLLIRLPYRNYDVISVNYEFEMYHDRYKISDIDYTQVNNDTGILTINSKQISE